MQRQNVYVIQNMMSMKTYDQLSFSSQKGTAWSTDAVTFISFSSLRGLYVKKKKSTKLQTIWKWHKNEI